MASYASTGLAASTTYYFRTRSYNTAGYRLFEPPPTHHLASVGIGGGYLGERFGGTDPIWDMAEETAIAAISLETLLSSATLWVPST